MTRARIYVALAVLTAFLTGSVFAGYIGPRLSNTPATLTEQPRVVAREPATRYVAERRSPAVKRHRSWEREALIVGGGAGAGAAIGVPEGRDARFSGPIRVSEIENRQLWGLLWGPLEHLGVSRHSSNQLATTTELVEPERVAGLSAFRSTS